EMFRFNVPQRWSIAHYCQAILKKEPHVPQVRWLTTLAGYVHYRLTGENVMGVGEASGMFPVDPETGDYNARMLAAFDAKFGGSLKEKLPKVLKAGEKAGVLTERGAKWLDPTGALQAGAVMAPPEGDAGTGMVATNAVAPKTGNCSAGTSIFAMAVLDAPLKRHHPEIDVLTTPVGHEVAMVHCNNCTNEINAWAGLLGGDYERLFLESLKAESDCGGVVVVPFLSGEPVAGVDRPILRVERRPDARFTLANFFRAQIYSAFVSLKIGMDILAGEGVVLDEMMGHGGIFTTRGVAQQYLADALKTPVRCMATATEGGPWGMAVLAAYALSSGAESLQSYLAGKVFAGAESSTLAPTAEGMAGFARYAAAFKEAIHA
ncbi:MAG: ATPase, partial [Kiritimatiellae bacterium]|nr:ATPase [Kiritimatiellia bacterium]